MKTEIAIIEPPNPNVNKTNKFPKTNHNTAEGLSHYFSAAQTAITSAGKSSLSVQINIGPRGPLKYFHSPFMANKWVSVLIYIVSSVIAGVDLHSSPNSFLARNSDFPDASNTATESYLHNVDRTAK